MDNLIKILPEYYPQYDLKFKILFVGDVVGKSQLLYSAIRGTYEEYFTATVGFEFYTFNINLVNKVIKLQIWDTCSAIQSRNLVMQFCGNASLIIIVYSIENKQNFINVSYWLNETKKHCGKDCKFFLVGNKMDLEYERAITRKEAEEFARKNNFAFFDECSAKLGINTQNILIQAAKILSSPFIPHLEEKIKKREEKIKKHLNNNNIANYISY